MKRIVSEYGEALPLELATPDRAIGAKFVTLPAGGSIEIEDSELSDQIKSLSVYQKKGRRPPVLRIEDVVDVASQDPVVPIPEPPEDAEVLPEEHKDIRDLNLDVLTVLADQLGVEYENDVDAVEMVELLESCLSQEDLQELIASL